MVFGCDMITDFLRMTLPLCKLQYDGDDDKLSALLYFGKQFALQDVVRWRKSANHSLQSFPTGQQSV